MTNTEIDAQFIADALDASGAEDVSIRPSYEGRYGARSGFAVTMDSESDVDRFFLEMGLMAGRMEAEADELGEDSDVSEEDIRDLVRAARRDSMGRSLLVSFPGFSLDGDLGHYGEED